jgi:hypothetical protein
MRFCFYPKHEYACPHVSHCPHLGGAALGNLVLAADENEEFQRMLFGQADYHRKRATRLFNENEALKAEVEQLKLELKVERQSKFATSADSEPDDSQPTETDDDRPKKRGAPVGHPGWFRPTPTHYDQLIEVDAPGRCPRCGGDVHLQLTAGRAALGELTPAPGRVFRPSVRVDQPGLESLLRPEGWVVRLLHRRWIFQAGAGP